MKSLDPDVPPDIPTLAAFAYLCGHPYAVDGEISPPCTPADLGLAGMMEIGRAVDSVKATIDSPLCPDCSAYDKGVRLHPGPLRAWRIYDAQRAWAMGLRFCLVSLY